MENKLELSVLTDNEDIIGAVVADGRQILCSCMPEAYSESQISIAIETCSKSVIGTRTGSFSTQKIVYQLQNSILLVQHIVDHVFLLVLCHPIKDLPLVDIYINIMVDQIKSFLDSREEKAELPTIDELKSGRLSAHLERILDWLTHVLGPAAKFVMDDALEGWIQTGHPDAQHFNELFRILEEDLTPDAQKEIRSEFFNIL